MNFTETTTRHHPMPDKELLKFVRRLVKAPFPAKLELTTQRKLSAQHSD
jgi:hypothetical protein